MMVLKSLEIMHFGILEIKKILLFQNLLQISENQPFMGVQHYPILLYQIL